mmetsp:Transcript_110205/g.351249  ORF Transcript_110205/g.351249 Transcript_110205/m.351249 type:complete len:119 (+) Transcript_110205:1040-1396(+)
MTARGRRRYHPSPRRAKHRSRSLAQQERRALNRAVAVAKARVAYVGCPAQCQYWPQHAEHNDEALGRCSIRSASLTFSVGEVVAQLLHREGIIAAVWRSTMKFRCSLVLRLQVCFEDI